MNSKARKMKQIVAIGLVVVSSGSWGQTRIGEYDCGQWMAGSNTAKAWLMGYLSGFNFMAHVSGAVKEDPLGKANSSTQLFLWMDNYCKANPLKSVGEGARDLYIELLKK